MSGGGVVGIERTLVATPLQLIGSLIARPLAAADVPVHVVGYDGRLCSTRLQFSPNPQCG